MIPAKLLFFCLAALTLGSSIADEGEVDIIEINGLADVRNLFRRFGRGRLHEVNGTWQIYNEPTGIVHGIASRDYGERLTQVLKYGSGYLIDTEDTSPMEGYRDVAPRGLDDGAPGDSEHIEDDNDDDDDDSDQIDADDSDEDGDGGSALRPRSRNGSPGRKGANKGGARRKKTNRRTKTKSRKLKGSRKSKSKSKKRPKGPRRSPSRGSPRGSSRGRGRSDSLSSIGSGSSFGTNPDTQGTGGWPPVQPAPVVCRRRCPGGENEICLESSACNGCNSKDECY